MAHDQRMQLQAILRARRAALGLSLREVARRAGIDPASLSRLEAGKLLRPTPENLRALAGVLDVPLADLYAAADYLPATALPSLRPYMRAKYHELPDSALAEVEALVARLSQQRGPIDHEDEH